MKSQLEREEDLLDDEFERGDMTNEEYNKAMDELHRDQQGYAEEAAQDAYDQEMERW